MGTHQHSADGPSSCFGCKLKGLTFAYTYGQDNFHGPTIRERERKLHEDNAKAGNEITPVGNRWV